MFNNNNNNNTWRDRRVNRQVDKQTQETAMPYGQIIRRVKIQKHNRKSEIALSNTTIYVTYREYFTSSHLGFLKKKKIAWCGEHSFTDRYSKLNLTVKKQCRCFIKTIHHSHIALTLYMPCRCPNSICLNFSIELKIIPFDFH